MDAGRFLDADTFELRNSTGTPRDTYLVHDPIGDLMRQPTPLPLSSAMDGQMRGEYAAAERGIITVPSIPPSPHVAGVFFRASRHYQVIVAKVINTHHVALGSGRCCVG